MRLTLFRKFLLLLVPAFVVLASVGIGVARHLEARDHTDDLAARIGTQAGRIALALSRHDAIRQPRLADDLMGAFASEVAVLCAELRDAAQVRRASYPAVIGCTAQQPTASIELAVGENETATLFVGYSTAVVDEQARRRTLLLAGIVSTAFVITLLSAGFGFRMLVSRRLDRLHRAITRAAEGAERVRVEPSRGNDELGDIIRAYDALVVREERHEAELRGAHQQLDEQSRRDPLTGAFNRRHVQEHIHEVAEVAGAALALFDIDHFKRINDRHGHGVGDEVLVEVVRRIGQVVRKQDLFARWGGEEFLLCVGEVGDGGLDQLARRLLACLDSAPVMTSAGPIVVTASIGLVAFPLRTGTGAHAWADAVTVADWGLYRAKQSGRDCAVVIDVQDTAAGGNLVESVPIGGGTLSVVPHVVRSAQVSADAVAPA